MGYDFKESTPGYMGYYDFRKYERFFWHSVVDIKDNPDYNFVYDPVDGLWATFMLRIKWKEFPYRHPHYTLFQAITMHHPDIIKT